MARAVLTGLGNVIIGYDEGIGTMDSSLSNDKSGSHCLVVGGFHLCSSAGSLVAGAANNVTELFFSVTGAANNTVSGAAMGLAIDTVPGEGTVAAFLGGDFFAQADPAYGSFIGFDAASGEEAGSALWVVAEY